MRKITMIVIHCDGIMPHQHNTIAKIDAYHRSKGWRSAGYHEYVRRDGTIEHGRNIAEPGAHVVGHNRHSVAICYEGGLNAEGREVDTRTPEQVRALRELVEKMHTYFPEALIVGHHDLNPSKTCPCFDAVKEYWDLQPAK